VLAGGWGDGCGTGGTPVPSPPSGTTLVIVMYSSRSSAVSAGVERFCEPSPRDCCCGGGSGGWAAGSTRGVMVVVVMGGGSGTSSICMSSTESSIPSSSFSACRVQSST
jgi:hypothetical protein